MNANAQSYTQIKTGNHEHLKYRQCTESYDTSALTDIYHDNTNIVIWRRQLPAEFQQSIADFVQRNIGYQSAFNVSPKSALSTMRESFRDHPVANNLSEDIAELVDMFCCLFDLKHSGLRLTALDRAMCPRFHVDRVPCRLVTTYHGVATQWLPHNIVDRTKLGSGNMGLSDNKSGLYPPATEIPQLNCGDVALLKGESWDGNEGCGLVHRSPAPAPGESRLLLTLDFLN